MRKLLITTAAVLALAGTAQASGRAACPGAVSGPGWDKNVGVIATKATDMEGDVYAELQRNAPSNSTSVTRLRPIVRLQGRNCLTS
jgi:hypothetical protein